MVIGEVREFCHDGSQRLLDALPVEAIVGASVDAGGPHYIVSFDLMIHGLMAGAAGLGLALVGLPMGGLGVLIVSAAYAVMALFVPATDYSGQGPQLVRGPPTMRASICNSIP